MNKKIKVFSGENPHDLAEVVNKWGVEQKSWRVVGVHRASFLTHIFVEYEGYEEHS